MAIMYVTPGGIATPSSPDNQSSPLLGGKSNEGIVAELHGKYYTAAYRNRVFCAPTLIAGVTLPINTTTAATYLIYNPLGSGVNMELIALDVVSLNAGTIGSLLLGVSTQTPTSVTALTPVSIPIGGGGVAQGKAATAGTITAITTLYPVGQIQSTTGATPPPHYDFDGKIVIAPGGMVSLFSNPAQSVIAVPCMTWAEWPI